MSHFLLRGGTTCLFFLSHFYFIYFVCCVIISTMSKCLCKHNICFGGMNSNTADGASLVLILYFIPLTLSEIIFVYSKQMLTNLIVDIWLFLLVLWILLFLMSMFCLLWSVPHVSVDGSLQVYWLITNY